MSKSDQSVVGDGDAVSVVSEIAQHVFWSTEGRLGIDHQVVSEQRSEPGGKGSRISEPSQRPVELNRAIVESGIPTFDPFLWDHGKMIDLGTLGGTNGFAQCATSRHEAIGLSHLAGDTTFHAFLWRAGRMTDLGTLGGDDSEAIWINDAGVIAGSADLPTPGIHDAVRWKDGQILDLGTIGSDACSRGRGINAQG